MEVVIKSYGERLEALIAERGPLCVGIDPHPSLLASWGLASNAAGLEQCARGMIEALGAIVPVFKPQSAFFEAHGAAGSAVLERTMADIKAAGALCILDVKRGDIGSTMDAYAAAYLSDGSPLAADAITVSPYLGFGTLDAAIELADQGGRGIYVLALTSNPEGPQDSLVPPMAAQSDNSSSMKRRAAMPSVVSNQRLWGPLGSWWAQPSGRPARTSPHSTGQSFPRA